jgi:putative membrane protein
MFLEILLFLSLGVALGIITGLIPGLHPNTVFVLTLSLTFIFSSFPIYCVLAFIISLAVSNTFFDFIPAILFGAPEEDSVLSVLPGHRLLLKGRGYEALFLTVMGGLGVMLLTILSLPALFYFLPLIYETIKPVMHILLSLVVVWMIFTERGKRKTPALLAFLFAGILGFLTLNSLPSEQSLFPALTGLFALSTLVTSIITKIKLPPQKKPKEIRENWVKGSVIGWIAGMLAGLLPGIGSSQAGIIAAQILRAKLKDFLIALGGINTSNIFFTFIVFYVIGKTRSGAVWALSQVIDTISFFDIAIIITVGFVTCLISGVLTIKTGGIIVEKMKKINYIRMMFSTLSLLFLLVFIFTGITGILISLTGMFIGLFAISFGVRRTHLMGFLLLPTIIYFSGANPFFLNLFF